MEKEQLHKKLDDFLSGSNKEKVDKELFSLLVRMDECRKKATPPDKDRMWEQVCRTLKHSRRRGGGSHRDAPDCRYLVL